MGPKNMSSVLMCIAYLIPVYFILASMKFGVEVAVTIALLLYWYFIPTTISMLVKVVLPGISQDTVGFFHPFTQDGGGGERVLWCAVRALQEQLPHARVVVYSQEEGDGRQEETAKMLRSRAKARFGIQLPRDVEVVHLQKTRLVLDSTWPRFTLLGQALGGALLTWEALTKCVPALFIDTGGYAFGYPLTHLAGCTTCCYVHYPFVSTDMLQRVRSGQAMYNNSASVARSPLRTWIKIFYYRLIAIVYGVCGRYAKVVMVNSSWTADHIRSLWRPQLMYTVFPPCDTSALQKLPLDNRGSVSPATLVSVAQFRPEKNHSLQIQAFHMARNCARGGAGGTLMDSQVKRVLSARLVLVGGCRNSEDESRLQELKNQAEKLGLSEHVQFLPGLPHSELVELLGNAIGGLHTMLDEHFGISIVEYMAAGVIPIAHKSGGPKSDIVVATHQGKLTGRLATTPGEYAAAMLEVLSMSEDMRLDLAGTAREHASKFSDNIFEKGLTDALAGHLKIVKLASKPPTQTSEQKKEK